MRPIKEFIEQKIKEKGITKELIISTLGMSRVGFDQSLRNETISLKNYGRIVDILCIDPSEIFSEVISMIDKSSVEQNIPDKFDTELDTHSEILFLRTQVSELTGIISNLSRLLNAQS